MAPPIAKVKAVRFEGRMKTGRTKPILCACETEAGEELQVVIKVASTMERNVVGLVAEALSLMLARDLGLQTPSPYLVSLSAVFISSVSDPSVRTALRSGPSVTFGTGLFTEGLRIVTEGDPCLISLLEQASEVFAFDVLIQNADRLTSNPNCLTDGNSFTLYDHELAFSFGIIGWREPWKAGALDQWAQGERLHLCHSALKGKACNLQRWCDALKAIPIERFDEYLSSLPPEWNSAHDAAVSMIEYIKSVQLNADDVLKELRRFLA